MSYVDYTGPKNIDYTGATPGGVIGGGGLLGITTDQPVDDVGGLTEEELLYGDTPLIEEEEEDYEGETPLEGNEGESVYEEPNYIYDGETDLEGESTPDPDYTAGGTYDDEGNLVLTPENGETEAFPSTDYGDDVSEYNPEDEVSEEEQQKDANLDNFTPFIPGVETHPETGDPLTTEDYRPQRPNIEVESPDTLYDEEIGDITGPGMQELPDVYPGETEAFPDTDYGDEVSEYDPQDDVTEAFPSTDYGDPLTDVSTETPDFLASSDIEDLNPNLDSGLQTTQDSSLNVDTSVDQPLTDFEESTDYGDYLDDVSEWNPEDEKQSFWEQMQSGVDSSNKGLESSKATSPGSFPSALQFAPRAYSFQDVTGSNINYGPSVNQGLAGFYRG